MLKVLVITLFMHEKTRKMKKAFCFDNCSCYNLRKNVSSSDFSFSQVTSVAKKEPRGTFLSLGLRPRLQKTFPRFPFFYFGNLGKTKIVRGQIFPQSSTTNYRNKILLIFGQKLSKTNTNALSICFVQKFECDQKFLNMVQKISTC